MIDTVFRYSICYILFGSCENHENSIFESWILTAEGPKLKMAAMPRRRDGERNYFTLDHNSWIPTHTQILRVGCILTAAGL